MRVKFPELPHKVSRFSAVDYLIEKGIEFYELTGEFPPLKSLEEIKPMPWYAIKINVFEVEKTLGIKRKTDFWEVIKEYLKNEIEDDMFMEIALKASF